MLVVNSGVITHIIMKTPDWRRLVISHLCFSAMFSSWGRMGECREAIFKVALSNTALSPPAPAQETGSGHFRFLFFIAVGCNLFSH